jgi:hypothetical protein
MKKLLETLRENVEGETRRELSEYQVKSINEELEKGGISKEKIRDGKINLVSLIGNVLKTQIIDINAFQEELFSRTNKWIEVEKEGVLTYPENVQDLLDKHNLTSYTDIIGRYFLRRVNNNRYRGYLVKAEKNKLVKKFVARYKALIFKKSNQPYVKLTRLSKDHGLYIPNRKNYIRKGEDSVVCLYSNLDRLMDENNILDEDILVDKNSLKEFYVFDNFYFVNPTKKWVDKWWNYDCPDLYKHILNIKGNSNMWGLSLVSWSRLLVQSSWSYTHVDEDITEKEVERFAGNHKNTDIYQTMQNILKLNVISEEEKKKLIKKVEKIEEEIQEIINENRHEILEKVVKTISNEDTEGKGENELYDIIRDTDGTMGLDCGFAYLCLLDKIKLFKEVANYDKETFRSGNGALKLDYPIKVQSTTIKRRMMEVIASLIESHTNYEPNYWTVLD